MLDRRSFFGWLSALIGSGAVQQVHAVQIQPAARPLFVMSFGGFNNPSMDTQAKIRESWYAMNGGQPPGDLVMLLSGTKLDVQFPGMIRTKEMLSDFSLEIAAPDLATYERLRELCVPKIPTIHYTGLSAAEIESAQRAWERGLQ